MISKKSIFFITTLILGHHMLDAMMEKYGLTKVWIKTSDSKIEFFLKNSPETAMLEQLSVVQRQVEKEKGKFFNNPIELPILEHDIDQMWIVYYVSDNTLSRLRGLPRFLDTAQKLSADILIQKINKAVLNQKANNNA